MSDKRKLPQGLIEKQELQRQETSNKVLRAAAAIKNDGGKVTISALMEYTGLSRSTFAKPHIRELLEEYGYSFGDSMAVSHKRKKVKQDAAIADKDRQISELRAKNTELEKECELLRGRIFLLMQKKQRNTSVQ